MPRRDQVNQGVARIHRIAQGLFTLRYIASAAHNGFPTVEVAAQSPGDVEVMHWPNPKSRTLRGPGDGLVIRALRDTTVVLKVAPAHPGGSISAELQLEPVSRFSHPGFANVQAESTARGQDDVRPRQSEIEILAHVARRGDVVVRGGEWICGPDDPMPIEGLEIRWPNRPRGLEILTCVSVGKGGRHESSESLIGEFVGTRGRATPITGLEMSLVGTQARKYSLQVDAKFSGSSVQTLTGRSISLSGPSSREPLVGLRLSAVASSRAEAVSAPARPVNHEQPKPLSNWRSTGRVRVFRGAKKGASETVSRKSERV